MSKEIIELLEEAKRNLFQCNARKLIDQALTKLREAPEQPSTSEFTKLWRIKLENAVALFRIGKNPDEWFQSIVTGFREALGCLDSAEAENKELKEIILTAPGSDEENFLSKHRIWWDLHYRELRSPGCNLPRPTFKQLQTRLDTSEAARKDLLEACEAALEFIGRSNKTDWNNEITPILKVAIAKEKEGENE